LPIWQKEDVEKQRSQIVQLEFSIGIDNGLTGNSVGKNKDNEE